MITLRPPRVGQLHGRPQLHAWHAHVIHILQRKSGFSLRSAVQCWSVFRGELKNSALHVRATFRGRNVVHEGHLFDRFIFKSQQITHWICRSWTSCRGFACWNCPSETVIATCTETGPKAWRNISWHSLTMLDIEWPIWYNRYQQLLSSTGFSFQLVAASHLSWHFSWTCLHGFSELQHIMRHRTRIPLKR